jgi:hypothetical protein
MPRNPFLDQVPTQDFSSVSYYLQSKLNVPVISSSYSFNSTSASYALNSPNITSGTAAPSGGNDGDIYLQYV